MLGLVIQMTGNKRLAEGALEERAPAALAAAVSGRRRWEPCGRAAEAAAKAGCGQAMAQMELLWAAALLMLLGAAISLCVKCQLFATKREKQLSNQRSQLESQRRFEVIRTHPSTTRRLEQIKEPEHLSIARKTTKELSASCHADYGSKNKCRYQNFLTEDQLQEDATYVEPIALDYYNCARFFTPAYEKECDSHSYQNVIIGVSCGSDSATDDAEDYENSRAIHIWKLQQAEALQAESSDEEPDYINTAPVAGPAPLSKQSVLHKV